MRTELDVLAPLGVPPTPYLAGTRQQAALPYIPADARGELGGTFGAVSGAQRPLRTCRTRCASLSSAPHDCCGLARPTDACMRSDRRLLPAQTVGTTLLPVPPHHRGGPLCPTPDGVSLPSLPRSKLKNLPPLSCLDRIWIALGIARGLDALHSAGRVLSRTNTPPSSVRRMNLRLLRPRQRACASGGRESGVTTRSQVVAAFPQQVHRDIKSCNILIDEHSNPVARTGIPHLIARTDR